MKNIISFKNNNKIEINISKEDYLKIEQTILVMKKKYAGLLDKLYKKELESSKTFNYKTFKREILGESKIIENIIRDVLKIYSGELTTLECVFLSGSYARGTNKLASDIDLHFFYKNGIFNYKYEEIICYIISITLNKSRDCIDPTFILNLSSDYKKIVTANMTNSRLEIVLKEDDKTITYFYSKGKKRRFFLQYNNSRNIKNLEQYILTELGKENSEWLHCFKVIYGEKTFEKIYTHIYSKEKEIINCKTLLSRIRKHENLLNTIIIESKSSNISNIKQAYQSLVFEQIYEYISILRMFLIYKNNKLPYINLFELYDVTTNINSHISNAILKIYEYMWNLRNLTTYCYKNCVIYGLHNDEIINYDTSKLDIQWNELKQILIGDLKEMRENLWEN